MFSPSSSIHSFDTNKPCTLLSGEKATELTKLQWPSSVCCNAPVAAFQSCTMLLLDLNTISLSSGEKTTELTGLK
jgi:hypothetical protein